MKKLIIFFILFVFISSDPFDGSARNKQSFFKRVAKNTFLKGVPIYNEIELSYDVNDTDLNKAKMFIYNEEDNIDFVSFLKNKKDLSQKLIDRIEMDTHSLENNIIENIEEPSNDNNKLKMYYHFYKSFTFKNRSEKRLIIAFYGKIKGELKLERTVNICDSYIFDNSKCKTETIIDNHSSAELQNYFRSKLEKLFIEPIKKEFYDSIGSL